MMRDNKLVTQTTNSPRAAERVAAESTIAREHWFGAIQTFLEQMIEAAPDETCRTFARNLWDETAEFTDDD